MSYLINEKHLGEKHFHEYVSPSGHIVEIGINQNTAIINLDGVDVLNRNVDGTTRYIDFDTTDGFEHLEGRLHWEDDDKTLELGMEGGTGVRLQIGQEIHLRATNKSGGDISNGEVVYIDGVQGQRPTISKASNSSPLTAITVIGVATHDIGNNNTGYVTTLGIVRDLDTSGFSEGDMLYLASTAGTMTATRPTAPATAVIIGFVTYAHATEGAIVVQPVVVQRLSYLSDVGVRTTEPAGGSVLYWNTTDDKWEASDSIVSGGEVVFGDVSGGNYTEIRTDGTVRGYGTATAWKDMIADLFGKRLLSQVGKIDYDYDENAMVFAPEGAMATANDRVGGNLEINHDFRVGSNITFKPHIHWWQPWASDAVGSVVFEMRYRLQRNNTEKTTTWTTITCEAGTVDDVFDFTGEGDGTYNQISRFDDITIDCGVSDTIQFQMVRTDSVVGDIMVYFMDLHGEIDSFGSEDEIAKT